MKISRKSQHPLDVDSWGVTRKVGGKVSHEKKTLLPSIESCLFNRDPYFMVHYNAYITGEDFILYIPQPTMVFSLGKRWC